MIEAAAVVRVRGPGGFAGFDRESADALAALPETLAEDWRSSARLSAGVGARGPIREPAPQFRGPLIVALLDVEDVAHQRVPSIGHVGTAAGPWPPRTTEPAPG